MDTSVELDASGTTITETHFLGNYMSVKNAFIGFREFM